MKDMKNRVEVRRIYTIKTPEGIDIEIERGEDSLSEELTASLLEEDNISALLDSRIVVVEKKKDKKRRYNKKKTIKHKTNMRSEGLEVLAEEKKTILPVDRINTMLKIEGEFTRLDYQKRLEDSGFSISNYNAHTDIQGAKRLGKIEKIGGKGKDLRRYKVIDSIPVSKNGLRKIRMK